MQQIRAFGPQDLRVVEVPDPVPGKDEVVVAVKACGICGSDKWFWYVEEPRDYVAGHEAAGEVVAVGSHVKHLKVGDRVAINNVKGCGQCEACLDGAYVRCPNGVEHMGFGFSDKVAVPERNCLVLHDSITYEAGSLIFDNWGTPYSLLKHTNMKSGDTVVVFGCGPIGLAAIGLAKQRGADVIAVDPEPSRREAAKRTGAIHTVAPSERTAQDILNVTDQVAVDYVVECAGQAVSYETALQILRIGGTLMMLGEGAKVAFNSSQIIHKHLTLLGSLYSTMEDGRKVQELMVQGEIRPLDLVTHRFPLRELPEQFGKVITFSEGLLKAVVLANES